MKKRYVEFLKIYILELIVGVLMEYYEIRIESDILNAVAALLVILPMLIFLYFAGKDQMLDAWKRYISKFFFGYIIFCYIGTLIVKVAIYICN